MNSNRNTPPTSASSDMPVELMIMSGPDDGAVLRLSAPREPNGYLFGRREDCDIILPYDSQISRTHARLYKQDDQWYMQDLNSKNGTYLGRTKITAGEAYPIQPGQLIRLGRIWVRLQGDPSVPESSDA